MNRLQKKCFIAATGFHLLLLLILIVGPGFFSGNKVQETKVLTFFDLSDLSKITDGPTTGTGARGATPPAPAPPAPEPPPTPVRQLIQPPKPVVAKAQPAEPEPENETKSAEKNPFAEKSPKKKIEISTNLVSRSATKPKTNTTRETSQQDTEAQARAEAARIAAKIKSVAGGLKSGLSPSTAVDINGGSGDGGSVNWAQAVVSIYYDAWMPPVELAASETVNTKVSITIRADGSIVSARIIKPSGISAADNSVQHALNRVSSLPRFPQGSKDRERTITINFNPLIKKQAG